MKRMFQSEGAFVRMSLLVWSEFEIQGEVGLGRLGGVMELRGADFVRKIVQPGVRKTADVRLLYEKSYKSV